MKWGTVEKRRGEPRYDEADAIAAFAARHGLALHGHTPVWYRNMPPWAPEAIRAGEAEALLRGVVSGMVGRYRGRARSWDVVNEALEPKEGRPDRLRRNPWLDALGPDYLDLAYRVARETDPDAMLVYNDYWFDFDDRTARDRRAAALRLLEDFRKRGTPVDALGIQAHLIAGGPVFREAPMRRFLAQVAAMGYKILITELDVRDTPLPPDIALRDQAVADLATRYLDVVLDERAVAGVITWGLSDKYTWLNDQAQFPRQARADRGVNRALPLDVDMNRKPLWTAIARAIDAAPAPGLRGASGRGAGPRRDGGRARRRAARALMRRRHDQGASDADGPGDPVGGHGRGPPRAARLRGG
jgi:endo-1,4-beta-xylanase